MHLERPSVSCQTWEVAAVAKISPVQLEIVPNVGPEGKAQVTLLYELWPSGDDVEAERGYQEVAELLSMGLAIPHGRFADFQIRFTSNDPAFRRSEQRYMEMGDLKAHVGPLADASIVARVTLTPLPSRDSNIVTLPAKPEVG
jgi:hypothetical protein